MELFTVSYNTGMDSYVAAESMATVAIEYPGAKEIKRIGDVEILKTNNQ